MLPYRTRPQDVHAIQFSGKPENVKDILNWAMGPRGDYELREDARRDVRDPDSKLEVSHTLIINKWLGTPREALHLWTGSWLVKDANGEFTVYSDEEFQRLFETR